MSDTYPQPPMHGYQAPEPGPQASPYAPLGEPAPQPGPYAPTGPIPGTAPLPPGSLPPYAAPVGAAWNQAGQNPSVFGAPPGAYPGGYAPVPATPPQPSPLLQPDFWAAKLPLVALVTLITCVVGGLGWMIFTLTAVRGVVSGIAYQAISGLLARVLLGVVAYALIMAFAHLLDLMKKDKS